MHPRYFIGIELPPKLSKKIISIQARHLHDQAVMEPLVPHITLLHPNILMSLSPLYVIPLIKKLSLETLPINVDLKNTAMFDDRVLHITVNSPSLHALHEKLVGLLPDDIRTRYEVGRAFTPHVTLAQAKPLQSLDTMIIDNIKSEVASLLPASFEVSALSQFRWLKARSYSIKPI